MYNAMASFESAGSKGSTRLHMDMADALNIMTFASLTPDGKPGTAAWDLFRAGDSEKIRQFLKNKFKGAFQHDPIHSQQCYLDTALRHELWTEFGVKSYRIYQKPGEAVFIPAGCAHQVCYPHYPSSVSFINTFIQVCNLADCVKVAVDFVSPENIQRCENLTREFREQNQSMVWKEDVLQLRTMMWFAWLSCRLQEKEML
jgi:lysine-specific demethylase 3